MKSLIMIFLFIAPGFVLAQNDIINEVKEVMKTGSSREMVKLLGQSVDMELLDGNMKSYSRAQAEFVLKDFFKKHPPTSFTIIHQGASKAGLPYVIGEFISDNNTFRVFVRVKKSGEKYFVHQISFNKE
ncbi:MAG: DUF4783 domain-containing protein [Cyclobacteriaceae bacterium]|nr:DUF4783 domain-containing protein [Cyclobacteriaceae bacterium]